MDDKQIKEILERQEKTQALVEKLWKAEKWRRFFTIFKYVVYLGIIFGAFYFLTPYVEPSLNLFQGLQSVGGPQDLQKLLEPFQTK